MSCHPLSDTPEQTSRRAVANVLYAREAREKAEEAFGEAAKKLSKANAAYDDAIKTAAELVGPSMQHDEILVSPVDPRFGLMKTRNNLVCVVSLLGTADLGKPARVFSVPTSRAAGNPTLALSPLGCRVEVEGALIRATDPDRHRPVLNPRAACGNKTVVDLG